MDKKDALKIKLMTTINFDNEPMTPEQVTDLVDEWFFLPTYRFDGKTPNEMIDEGNYDEVRDVVEEMYSSKIFF